MKSSKQKISAVVLNWNRPSDTIDTLKSLQSIKLPNKYLFNIYLIDNNSSDNSVNIFNKYLKSKHKYEVKLIKKNNNLGFAEGNNAGIRKALKNNNKYILVINNDVRVDKNFLSTLVTFMDAHPKVGVVSPKIYFEKGYEFHKKYKKNELGKVIWYAGGDFDWRNIYGSNKNVDKVDNKKFTVREKTDFATGACALYRNKALKETGLFDEQYFMYLEDVDLSQRLKNKGWQVWYSGKSHIWHKVSQSSKIGGELNDYFIHRNRLLFAARYASMRTKFALFRESIKFMIIGRKWQKRGVIDYYLGNFGKGSWR